MPRGVPVMTESAALSSAGNLTDNVNVGAGTIFANICANGATFLFWLLASDTANAVRDMFGKSLTSGGYEMFKRGVDGTIVRFTRYRTSGQVNIETASGGLVANEWAFWAVTVQDGVTANDAIYKGTVARAAANVTSGTPTETGTAPASDAAISLRLMSTVTPSSSWPGKLAPFGLFNRVLSLSEIQAWQFSALDEPYPAVMGGCVGLWYPGNDGPNKVIDYSGYHNDGTITGATISRGLVLPTQNIWTRTRPRFRTPDAAAGAFAAYYRQYYRDVVAA